MKFEAEEINQSVSSIILVSDFDRKNMINLSVRSSWGIVVLERLKDSLGRFRIAGNPEQQWFVLELSPGNQTQVALHADTPISFHPRFSYRSFQRPHHSVITNQQIQFKINTKLTFEKKSSNTHAQYEYASRACQVQVFWPTVKNESTSISSQVSNFHCLYYISHDTRTKANSES